MQQNCCFVYLLYYINSLNVTRKRKTVPGNEKIIFIDDCNSQTPCLTEQAGAQLPPAYVNTNTQMSSSSSVMQLPSSTQAFSVPSLLVSLTVRSCSASPSDVSGIAAAEFRRMLQLEMITKVPRSLSMTKNY